jgi:APA family basic amino acid/polyamine antiporter
MPSSSDDDEAGGYLRQRRVPFPSESRPSWLRKKPLWVVLQEIEQSQQPQQHTNSSNHHHIERHLSLLDLISVGVGGTIGSGIFVLAGFIAHNYAGPATALSFAISGLAAAASGVCYAELSGRIPSAGSTYVYSYVCLGEVAAVIAASCLTLEYGVSGAAVARSWGDKVVAWLRDQWHLESVEDYLEPHGINLMAGVVSTVSVLLLLGGVHESKQVTNFFTVTKMALVVFMTVGGYCLFHVNSIHSKTASFAPYGATGVLRGATSSFFGYLGYDEVCCIAGESINPQRDMPRAVLWTLLIVTILYIFASFALTGMLPFDEISETSGFPAAFHDRDVPWAANISAVRGKWVNRWNA